MSLFVCLSVCLPAFLDLPGCLVSLRVTQPVYWSGLSSCLSVQCPYQLGLYVWLSSSLSILMFSVCLPVWLSAWFLPSYVCLYVQTCVCRPTPGFTRCLFSFLSVFSVSLFVCLSMYNYIFVCMCFLIHACLTIHIIYKYIYTNI